MVTRLSIALGAAMLLAMWMPGARGQTLGPATAPSTQPANAPATRPVDERADRELNSQLSKLDAEYKAKKVVILRRYLAQLEAAQRVALRAKRMDDAQRIYEAAANTAIQISDLSPSPTVPLAKPAFKFTLKLNDFDGAAGLSAVAVINETTAELVAENDFGRPPKVIWKAPLTPQQQDRLSKFLRSFPLDRLENSYVDPNVFDGYQMLYEIQIGDSPLRKIAVGNRRQADLERLVDEVNEILPPGTHINKMD